MQQRQELKEAFLKTTYRVFIDNERKLDFKFDHGNQPFTNWILSKKISSWAFLTPCNPGAKIVSSTDNLSRIRALRQDLNHYKIEFLDAVHISASDTNNHWPDEAGFFLIGCSKEIALELARNYQQVAFIFCLTGANPELIMVEPFN